LKRGGNNKNSWENYTPDGIKIPDGKIYGKDFNPVMILIPDFDSKTGRITMVPLYLWNKYQDYKKKLEEYSKEKEVYDKELKKYRKQMDKLKKQYERWENDPIRQIQEKEKKRNEYV
jgi:hypothetical protein